MSIVEKAIDKLRQSRDHTGDQPDQPDQPKRPDPPKQPDHSATASAGPMASLERARETAPPVRDKPKNPVLKIDRVQLCRNGLYPSKAMAKRLGDEFRRLKRPLLAGINAHAGSPASSHANRIMVTSAEGGEGKTFTAMNLALSLSLEHEHDVLLVDGDVVRRSLSTALGLENRIGLMDLLSDPRRNPEDVLVPTDVDGLVILPCGSRHEISSELFSSRRMASMMNRMASPEGRIVIVDSPPVLGAAETLALATYLQQIVMVVRAGVTLEHKVKTALEMLESEQDKFISLVLNQNTGAHGNYYYYY